MQGGQGQTNREGSVKMVDGGGREEAGSAFDSHALGTVGESQCGTRRLCHSVPGAVYRPLSHPVHGYNALAPIGARHASFTTPSRSGVVTLEASSNLNTEIMIEDNLSTWAMSLCHPIKANWLNKRPSRAPLRSLCPRLPTGLDRASLYQVEELRPTHPNKSRSRASRRQPESGMPAAMHTRPDT